MTGAHLKADEQKRLSAALAEHLDPAEIEQARARLDGLLESGTFPQPHPDWPAVPWPWY